MFWVMVFGGIALAGLVMLVSYGIWLAHKASDVLSEVAVLGERAAELGDLMAQVRIPSATYDDRDVAIVASEERES